VKDKVLRAARQLIGNGAKPSRIRVTDLVAARACSEQELSGLFPDFAAFQRELCALLFADAREAIIKATTGIGSGLKQLTTAFIAYLDYNLAHPDLQELAHHIQQDPQGWELLQRMEVGVALVAQADLDAMNASLRSARARLLTSLVVAVVRAEYQAKRALPDLREALLDYCRLSGPAPVS